MDITASGGVSTIDDVESLAKMFSDMDYSVLYEGVEQDEEEKMCMEMEASYLQGFKYSKPIPIETLGTYLDKQSG